MNPFEQKPILIEDCIMDWASLYKSSYNKQDIDPYTRLRILMINAIETKTAAFSHAFNKSCYDNDLRREIALIGVLEQQQQSLVNSLKPIDETILETSISFEHLEIELLAVLSQEEKDSYVRQALRFTLLEDLDHLYRFANLLDFDSETPAQSIVGSTVDITPGRSSIACHRHPFDSIKNQVSFNAQDIKTSLNILIVTALKHKAMSFYMHSGNYYYNDLGRKLFLEICMIERQHLSLFNSLWDSNLTWLQNLLLQEYTECYLYYSFYECESDAEIKSIWEFGLQQELSHLHKAAELLSKYEKESKVEALRNMSFPAPLNFTDNSDFVKQVLKEEILLTSNKEEYISINNLPQNHEFYFYQNRINHNIDDVASHKIIAQHQQKFNVDYRTELKENPILELSDRTTDNTSIARIK